MMHEIEIIDMLDHSGIPKVYVSFDITIVYRNQQL